MSELISNFESNASIRAKLNATLTPFASREDFEAARIPKGVAMVRVLDAEGYLFTLTRDDAGDWSSADGARWSAALGDQIAQAIVVGAPPTLNTLQKLAAALDNNPGFATTMAAALAARATTAQLAAEAARASAAELELESAKIASDGWMLRRLGPNSIGAVLALFDRLRRTGWAVRHDASMWLGEVLLERSARNSLGLFWGLKDGARRISMGFDRAGGHWLGRIYNRPLGANSLDLWQAWGDPAGQVALGLRNDGTVILTTRDSNVWVQDGNIWAMDGDEARQLTSGGGVVAVENIGNGAARFVADWTGSLLQYVTDKAALPTSVRLYATTAVYWMMITTGQSLAQGGANAAITLAALNPGLAYKLGAANAVGSNDQTLGSTLQPLREYQYETISTSTAESFIRRGIPKSRRLIYAGQAWGGMEIEQTGPGGSTGVYEKILAQVANAKTATGAQVIVPAVHLIQGEADGLTADPDFDDDIEMLRAQYEAEISLITGQRDPIFLFVCQTSSVSGYRDTYAQRKTFRTPFQQLAASRAYPRVKLVGPKYFLNYKDHSHILAVDTDVLGEYHGRAAHRVLVQGLDWRPTQVDALAVDNDAIVLDYHTPTGALALDVTVVADPGNFGFNLHEAAGVGIAAVTQTGDRQITITCTANVPSGALLSYAHYNGVYGTSGRIGGARGCVRDSDPELSRVTGQPMRNYAVSFEETLTF